MKKKFKQIFDSWISMLSYISLELTITVLLLFTLFIVEHEDHSGNDPRIRIYQGIEKEGTFERIFGVSIVILLAFTLLFEFFKVVKETIEHVKTNVMKKKSKV
jgi:heme/copper-type cytochrome/quinol oxidase subunit 2